MSDTSTKPRIRDWFPRLLSGQPHQVIGGPDSPYMLRWHLIPRNPVLNCYLHKFLRSDDDRALHDHPWWFVSLILKGGYGEVYETDGGLSVLYRTSIFDWRSPFRSHMVAFRPATFRHGVALPAELRMTVPGHDPEVYEKPCWTLIVTGRRVRTWGFWCKQRFVPWREFGDAGCGEDA